MEHDALQLAQVLVSVFLTAAFLPAGLEKVLDWKGTRASWQELISRTPFRILGGLSFFALLVLELLAGCLCAAGVLALMTSHDSLPALLGALLAATASVGLFFAERLARDAERAARTAMYFVVAVAATFVLADR